LLAFVTGAGDAVRVFSAYIALAVTVLSLALYGTMMALFVRGMRLRDVRGTARRDGPKVSILKPLAGCDDELEENLESFVRLDYPSYEILLGVADRMDPAYGVARAFAARHPELDIRVVITDPNATMNPKTAQLVCLREMASGEVLVISDSNVRVSPTYLASMVSELSDPRVGMVWSVFTGNGERTLGAALENLQICASVVPGIVAFNSVTSRPMVVGKSMAFRAADLDATGGFRSVGAFLAEDHVLGRRFLDAGFLIRTSFDVVENRNTTCTVGGTVDRHTRWSKLRRAVVPQGFVFEPMMTPIVVATVALVAAPSIATAAGFAATCLAQTCVAMFAVRVARGRWLPWWYAPLEIVRSYAMLTCWLQACASRRIVWRGHPFTLQRGSVIVPLAASQGRSSGRTRLAA
jgi:ceramide glucosyltransferase